MVAAKDEMEVMSPVKLMPVSMPHGWYLSECHVYGPVLETDVVTNVPIANITVLLASPSA